MKWLLLGFLICYLTIGCGGESPVIEETPTLSYGVANSTAFGNLALIMNLEQIIRKETWLTDINAWVDLDGTISEGSAWGYTFAGNNPDRLYGWEVWSDGRIEEPEKGIPPPLTHIGARIDQYLKIDSPNAVKIARKNGADIYLKKYPNATIRVHYSGSSCSIQFEQLGSLCPIVITISADTGEVRGKDLACNSR